MSGEDEPLEVRIARLEAAFNSNLDWLKGELTDVKGRLAKLEGRLWYLLIAILVTLLTTILNIVLG